MSVPIDVEYQRNLIELILMVVAIYAPIVVGAVAVLKTVGLPLEFTILGRACKAQGLLAVLVAVIGAYLWVVPGNWDLAVLVGIVIGLTAAGEYSATKAVVGSS